MRLPSCRRVTIGVQRRDRPETRQTTMLELPDAEERDHTHTVDLARLGHKLDPDTPYDVVVIADGHPHPCRFRTRMASLFAPMSLAGQGVSETNPARRGLAHVRVSCYCIKKATKTAKGRAGHAYHRH